MKEIWKDIPGYEGYYQASTFGRIRSVDRVVSSREKARHIKGIIKRPRKGTRGYLNISLAIGGKKTQFLVHRIIAMTFLENPCDYPIINHKNGDTSDNRVENLEWCSLIHNYRHAATILHRNCGERPIECIETGQIYESIHATARALGSTTTQVWNVVSGKRLTVRGLHLEYADK